MKFADRSQRTLRACSTVSIDLHSENVGHSKVREAFRQATLHFESEKGISRLTHWKWIYHHEGDGCQETIVLANWEADAFAPQEVGKSLCPGKRQTPQLTPPQPQWRIVLGRRLPYRDSIRRLVLDPSIRVRRDRRAYSSDRVSTQLSLKPRRGDEPTFPRMLAFQNNKRPPRHGGLDKNGEQRCP